MTNVEAASEKCLIHEFLGLDICHFQYFSLGMPIFTTICNTNDKIILFQIEDQYSAAVVKGHVYIIENIEVFLLNLDLIPHWKSAFTS